MADTTKPAEKQLRGSDVVDHILAVAGDLFYRRGIRAVGIDEVIATAGVARATLYRHFPSKEDLVVAYLEGRSARLRAQFEAGVDPAAPPQAAVLALFDGLTARVTGPDFRGCAFFLAVSEHGDSPRIRSISESYKRYVRDHFARLLAPALTLATADLPDRLAIVYEGALSLAVILPGQSIAAHAHRSAELLLAAELAPSSSKPAAQREPS